MPDDDPANIIRICFSLNPDEPAGALRGVPAFSLCAPATDLLYDKMVEAGGVEI
jgi:hypothetical protein